MPQPTLISTALKTIGVIAIAVTLSACGGSSDGGSDDASSSPSSGSVIGTVTGDVVVIDRELMPELPCHAMDNTIMGECSEDDVAGLLAEMGVDKTTIILQDKQLMSEEACHVMERTIMGACSEEDVERLAAEIRAAP